MGWHPAVCRVAGCPTLSAVVQKGWALSLGTSVPGQVANLLHNASLPYSGSYSDALLPDMARPDLVGPAPRSGPFALRPQFGPWLPVVLTVLVPQEAPTAPFGRSDLWLQFALPLQTVPEVPLVRASAPAPDSRYTRR